jgi:hypothetical protein
VHAPLSHREAHAVASSLFLRSPPDLTPVTASTVDTGLAFATPIDSEPQGVATFHSETRCNVSTRCDWTLNTTGDTTVKRHAAASKAHGKRRYQGVA